MADEKQPVAGEYVCLVVVESIKDHKQHQPGEKIKLTAEQAEILLRKGAVAAK